MLYCLRPAYRLARLIIIYTLPITILPIISGLVDGVLFYRLFARNVVETGQHFHSNIEIADWMDWFSVPGGPGIHDMPKGPFYILELRDPRNWWKKMDMLRPDIDTFKLPQLGDLNTQDFADLDSLYKWVQPNQDWHHWIYASSALIHLSDGPLYHDWDSAFDELLQQSYVRPAANNASFHYLKCPGSFLCGCWSVRGPSLIHFTTEDQVALRQGTTSQMHLKQVSVRVIEFPLAQNTLSLIPGEFPSQLYQMQSVTDDSLAWRSHQEFVEIYQHVLRFEDYALELWHSNRPYRWLAKTTTWVADLHVSEVSEIIHFITTAITVAICDKLFWVVNFFWGLIAGEVEENPIIEQEPERPFGSPYENMMTDMVGSFLEHLGKDKVDLMNSTPEGQASLERIWNIARHGVPEDMDNAGDVIV